MEPEIMPGSIELDMLLRIFTGKLHQTDVMRLTEGLSARDRTELLSRLNEGSLLQEELGELGEVRSAQVVATLLPESAEIVFRYLRDPNAELVFATICALTDTSDEQVKDLRAELAAAVVKAQSMPGAEEASVDYIAEKYLRQLTSRGES